MKWIAIVAMVGGFSGCQLFFDLHSVSLRDVEVDSGSRPDQGDSEIDAGSAGDVGAGDAGTRDASFDASPSDSGNPDTGRADTGRADSGPLDAATPIDMAPPGPYGQTCPGDHPAMGGPCSLVDQDCPGVDDVCKVFFGPPASAQCFAKDVGKPYTLGEGDICDPGPSAARRCEEHLYCRTLRCVRYCDLTDARGCEPNQFCAPHDANAIPGLGFCTDSCSNGG